MGNTNDKDGTIPLYHYTDENGVRGILKEMRIGQSVAKPTGRDTAFGPGVYMTSISPKRSTRAAVMENNYDDAVARAVETDEIGRIEEYFNKTDKAFKIYMRLDEVKKCKSSRDIYLTTDGDIDLTTHKYKVVDGPKKLGF